MQVPVECFFDLSSPWTRLAFHNLKETLAGSSAALTWRPFLVGGVFNAVNPQIYASRQNPDHPRMRMTFEWLKEWAALAGVAMNFPSAHHPLKSVNAMRFCCALEDDQAALQCFAEAAFDAYFRDQRNLDDMAVLQAIADECGLQGDILAGQATSQSIKDRLRSNTQEAIDRGAFGSPTLFVDGQYQYFGNDQLPLVRQRIDQLETKATQQIP